MRMLHDRRPRVGLPYVLGLVALAVALGGGTFATAQTDPLPQQSTPPGTIAAYAGPTAPAGWLLANGNEVSRLQYPELFAAIGVTYGAGNGTTTFHLPDLRGRVAVAQGADADVDMLGDSDGRAVDSREVAHAHSLSIGNSSPGTSSAGGHSHTVNSHAHSIAQEPSVLQGSFAGGQWNVAAPTNMHNHGGGTGSASPGTSTAGAHTHTVNAHSHGGSVGADGPAYLVLHYIIKH